MFDYISAHSEETVLNSRIMFALIATVLCAAVSAHADSAPTLTMTVNASTVTISGATPHGKVVFFGVARFIDRTTVTVRRLDQTVVDDDGDGVVTVNIGGPVPWKSIFAAVDFATGRYILGTPDAHAFPLIALQVKANPLAEDSPGVVKHIVLSHSICEMLHVRPGVGVWGQVLADGNKFDDDHASNGEVKANVAAGVAIGTGMPAAPDKFAKGDVVVLIERQRMQVWAAAVGDK